MIMMTLVNDNHQKKKRKDDGKNRDNEPKPLEPRDDKVLAAD